MITYQLLQTGRSLGARYMIGIVMKYIMIRATELCVSSLGMFAKNDPGICANLEYGVKQLAMLPNLKPHKPKKHTASRIIIRIETPMFYITRF